MKPSASAQTAAIVPEVIRAIMLEGGPYFKRIINYHNCGWGEFFEQRVSTWCALAADAL